MSTTYVSVGLQRIQAHLSRTQHLWGRRGASEEVVRLTMSPDDAAEKELENPPVSVDALSVPGVELNHEAPAVDGVLQLKGPDADTVIEAGMKLARTMKQRLPGLTIQVSHATTGTDESYVDLIQGAASSRWERCTFHPAPNEFPLVRPCDECRTGSASIFTEPQFGKQQRLCQDCSVRRNHDQSRHRTIVRPSRKYPNKFCAEWWLLNELNSERAVQERLQGTDDLTDLARLTRPNYEGRAREHTDNHTALISADGNGMGALFDTATRQAAKDRSTDGIVQLSVAIKEAMSKALITATKGILFDGDSRLPVVPHIMGGDDLLISVPGERCWEFLEIFLNSFEEQAENSSLNLPVSMSAGMLISRASIPLSSQVMIAEHLMKRAKQAVRGDGWSFAWLDLTQDGPEGKHDVWTLADLSSRRDALVQLSKMSENSVQSMMGAVADNHASVSAQKLSHLSHRMPETREFLTCLGIDLNSFRYENVRLVQDMISVGRWWR